MLDHTYSDTWKTRDGRLKVPYVEYLKSAEWLEVKRKAKERPFYRKCKRCKSTENINLHHKSYKWIGTPFAMRNLMPLCKRCHEYIHWYAKESGLSVRKATRRVIKGY